MLKRVFLLFALYLISTSVFAGAFYVAPTIAYNGYRASSVGYLGLPLRLALGYGGIYNEDFYLSAEIYGNPRPITIRNYPNELGNIEVSYSYGFSVLPEYLIDPMLGIYLRIGAIKTKFSAYDLLRIGGEAGIGIEGFMTRYCSVRAEYTYIRYRNLSDLGKPKVDEFSAAFVYRF